jgi:hypothetical protein
LPWEFIYDPRRAEYVCLSRNTPLVRYLPLGQEIRPLTIAPPLRILGMIASPSDCPPLDVAREREHIEESLRDLQEKGIVRLDWLEGQTWRDLQREMRKEWHVFHFIGHGSTDASAGEGMITLADAAGRSDKLLASELGRLLADQRSLRLVILNACEGARSTSNDVFSSVGAALVRRGVPAVLAMQHEISDAAAVEFSRTFYECVAEGVPIDTAATEARKAVSLHVSNGAEWGTPVLFMRSPDGVLFKGSDSAEGLSSTSATEQAPRTLGERMRRLFRVRVKLHIAISILSLVVLSLFAALTYLARDGETPSRRDVAPWGPNGPPLTTPAPNPSVGAVPRPEEKPVPGGSVEKRSAASDATKRPLKIQLEVAGLHSDRVMKALMEGFPRWGYVVGVEGGDDGSGLPKVGLKVTLFHRLEATAEGKEASTEAHLTLIHRSIPNGSTTRYAHGRGSGPSDEAALSASVSKLCEGLVFPLVTELERRPELRAE